MDAKFRNPKASPRFSVASKLARRRAASSLHPFESAPARHSVAQERRTHEKLFCAAVERIYRAKSEASRQPFAPRCCT
eukprot:scaffold1638_cov258-Pinguiococcus_pyrenoidosus.AAC.44